MLIEFTLRMPGVKSWNGRWSGEGRHYAVIKSFVGSKKVAKAQELIAKGSYHHHFGDGWVARIDVREVDRSEAAKSRKKSCGFSGYEWMITSILEHGQIFDTIGLEKHLAKQAEGKAVQA